MGQSRHFDRGPATSDLPPGTDIVSPGRHVSNLPKTELAGMAALGAERTFVWRIKSAKGQTSENVRAAPARPPTSDMKRRRR